MGGKRKHARGTTAGPEPKRQWGATEWLSIIIIPIFFSALTLWWANPVSDAYDAFDASRHSPCLEASGTVAPILTYRYPPTEGWNNSQAAWVDLPQGSLYAYEQELKNTGERDLVDITVRLNAPGVIVSAWTDRNESTTAAANARIIFGEANGSISSETKPVTRDPSVLRPPDLQLALLILLTPLTQPPPMEAKPPIYGYDSDWAKRIVWADGLPTISYRLPILHAGESWNATTIFFGNRTGPEAGGTLTAAVRTAGVDYYKAFQLTAFTPPPGRSAQNPGPDPWAEALPRICWSE